MIGLGTIINTLCVVAGGVFGLVFGKALKPRMQEAMITAIGVAVMFLGVGSTLEKMLVIDHGAISAKNPTMMIICLALGAVIGELLNIEGWVERFGAWLKVKSGSQGDNSFIATFVSTSCTVCIGAMSIVGAFHDAVGDYSTFLAKGILDAIFVCIVTASQGRGAIFSAVPVFLFQGFFTLLAVFLGSFIPQAALDNLSYVGSILIFCIGLNFLRTKKIRVANLLPSIFLAALWAVIF